MYTMEQWHIDGQLNIKVGQLVSDEVVNELANCVPPRNWGAGYFQVGEPYDNDAEDLSTLYATFIRKVEGWVYCGHCKNNQTEHREGYCEKLMREYEQYKQ